MTIKTHTFPSGLRLIYEKSINVLPISSINILCDVGSVYEPDNLRGVSHLIEHMCFKGTDKIKNPKDIFIEYDKIGAYFNAFTDKRYTCYVVKCDSDYIENSIKILSDMLMNSTFIKNEFIKEHSVVIEENTNNENDDEDTILIASDKSIYNGSSFAYPVDDLSFHMKNGLLRKDNLNYENVLQYYNHFYIPKNIVISIVTNISYEMTVKVLENIFINTKKNKTIENIYKYRINNNIIPQLDIKFNFINKQGVKNTLITMGFRTCSVNNPDKYKLHFLKCLLTSIMSGRFFTILREKSGLVYSLRIITANYDESGDFTFFTQTDNNKLFRNGETDNKSVNGLIPTLVSSFNDLYKNGITESELTITKGYIKGKSIIHMEDINNVSLYNGSEVLFSNKTAETIIPYADKYKTFYENITVNDINNIIKKYFKRELLSVTLLCEKSPKAEMFENEFRNIFRDI